jgi:putative copper export protein
MQALMEIFTLLGQVPAEAAPADGFDMLGYGLRILHIVAALILGGGIAYQRLVILPSLKAAGKDPAEFFANTRRKWAPLVGICALVLIGGGLFNFILTNRAFTLPKLYHPLFGVKFLLALAVIFIASVLSGKTALADKFRAKAQFWLSLNLALVIAIVLLASALRNLPKPPKAAVAPGPIAVEGSVTPPMNE